MSYITVGEIFEALDWFDSDLMKIVYFIVSTLVSFGLCYVIMLIETYMLYIAITLGVILVVIFSIFIYKKN